MDRFLLDARRALRTGLAVTAFTLAGPAAAATYTVGADAACTHTDLAAAISQAQSNPGTDFIHIARNQSYSAVALNIANQSLWLIGGYSDCADTVPSGRTTLNGAGGAADSVIEILAGDGSVRDLYLQNLGITGGEPDADFGGGIEIDGSNRVTLNNVSLSGNSSGRGGAIHFNGSTSARLFIDADSQIFGNSATDAGGGIYCSSSAGTLLRFEGNLFDNEALNGGGIYADHCSVAIIAPTVGDGVYFNRASGSGGGVHARNNSQIIGLGGAHFLVNFNLNDAGFDGGAFWLDNSGLTLVGAQLNSNSAGRDGGAIHAQSSASVTMVPFEGCQGGRRCSRLEDNLAGNTGGAINMIGYSLDLRGTWVTANRAAAGSAIRLANSDAWLQGNIIARNSLAQTVIESVNSNLRAYYNTVTHNANLTTAIGGSFGTLQIHNSIIYEAPGVTTIDAFIAQSASFDCIDFSVEPFIVIGADFIVADPLFVNPAGDDFRLSANSPLIDYCYNPTATSVPRLLDIDGQQRGFDAPGVPNHSGPFDLGADEWSDQLYFDGFETPQVPSG